MGSIPITRSKYFWIVRLDLMGWSAGCNTGLAQIAQLVEHTLGKGEVGGSNPLLGSRFVRVDVVAQYLYL